jgi:hypothetical protein
MTRLIDAEAVYKILEVCEIRKATIGNPLTDWEYGYTCGIERAESEIECAPTVDAVPVIRCKDCKWWKFNGREYYCDEKDAMVEPCENDYCSRAERKETA